MKRSDLAEILRQSVEEQIRAKEAETQVALAKSEAETAEELRRLTTECDERLDQYRKEVLSLAEKRLEQESALARRRIEDGFVGDVVASIREKLIHLRKEDAPRYRAYLQRAFRIAVAAMEGPILLRAHPADLGLMAEVAHGTPNLRLEGDGSVASGFVLEEEEGGAFVDGSLLGLLDRKKEPLEAALARFLFSGSKKRRPAPAQP